MPALIFEFDPDRQIRMPFQSRVELAVHLAIEAHGSVNAAAREIGVTRNVLFRWQHGVRPHRGNLEGLARAAGVPVEWLEFSNPNQLAKRLGDETVTEDNDHDPV